MRASSASACAHSSIDVPFLAALQSDTPPGSFDRASHVISLDHELRLKTPISSIPAGAAALPGTSAGVRQSSCSLAATTGCKRTHFLMSPADANVVVEIKHWKSKEKKFSVLAWSFLPAHVLIARSDAGGNGSLCMSRLLWLLSCIHEKQAPPGGLFVAGTLAASGSSRGCAASFACLSGDHMQGPSCRHCKHANTMC